MFYALNHNCMKFILINRIASNWSFKKRKGNESNYFNQRFRLKRPKSIKCQKVCPFIVPEELPRKKIPYFF